MKNKNIYLVRILFGNNNDRLIVRSAIIKEIKSAEVTLESKNVSFWLLIKVNQENLLKLREIITKEKKGRIVNENECLPTNKNCIAYMG